MELKVLEVAACRNGEQERHIVLKVVVTQVF